MIIVALGYLKVYFGFLGIFLHIKEKDIYFMRKRLGLMMMGFAVVVILAGCGSPTDGYKKMIESEKDEKW